VTMDGLKDLAALKQLTFLGLGDTKVTPDQIAELKKLLPNCTIGQ